MGNNFTILILAKFSSMSLNYFFEFDSQKFKLYIGPNLCLHQIFRLSAPKKFCTCNNNPNAE